VLRRLALAASFAVAIAACSGADGPDSTDEPVGETSEPLSAQCKANVRGVGTLDVETVYLPNVVHCENGGAPYEALKAQAIAARTYLYYKLETTGSIGDGQGDQVYSCGSKATAEQKQAVLDTAGIVLRYAGTTLCSFYVAGGSASGPSCRGGSASTEHYVTYNAGLSGSSIHQSTLGWVSPSNKRNRGCMSQLGSRCLASAGKKYGDILRFYYGADVVLEHATGACVGAATPPPPPPPAPPPATPPPATTPPATTPPATTPPTTTPPKDAGAKDAGDLVDGGLADAAPAADDPDPDPILDPGEDQDASAPLTLGARGSRKFVDTASCSASPGSLASRSPAAAWLLGLGLVLACIRSRRRPVLRLRSCAHASPSPPASRPSPRSPRATS
jgi:hypothetical protein